MEWYTQKEAAEILGVSKTTIYHYSKQGKIKKIPDPHRLHKEARYYKEEIDQMAAALAEQPTGYKPSEVAKYLGLSVQSVLKYIQNGEIRAEEVPFGDERISYIITEPAFQEAKELFGPQPYERIRKGEYYNSNHGTALYQHFQSPLIQTARVTLDNDLNWGFTLPQSQNWITIEEGLHQYKLQPTYDIHQQPFPNKGHATFQIPYKIDILYPFIDYLYKNWGIENVGIRDLKDSILIMVRAGEKAFSNVPFSLEDIKPFLIDGIIDLAEDVFVVRSAYKKTNIDLPINMITRIKELANEEDPSLTMSQWIEKELNKIITKRESSVSTGKIYKKDIIQ